MASHAEGTGKIQLKQVKGKQTKVRQNLPYHVWLSRILATFTDLHKVIIWGSSPYFPPTQF